MFDLKNIPPIKSKMPLIEHGQNNIVYDFDENVPILFYGYNSFGNKVIGSLLGEDDENGFFRFIHAIVYDGLFYDFIKGEISYRNLLKATDSLFLIDESYNQQIQRIYAINLETVPKEFLPIEDSYCPSIHQQHSGL